MKNSTIYLIIAVVIVLIALIISIVFVVKDKNQPSTINQQNQTTNEEKIQIEEPKVEETNEELKVEILKEGTGEKTTKVGDNITVNYTGTLTDGTKFDSSLDSGKPFSFNLGKGEVIQGWDQGLLGMKIGEKRKLTIPPSLGYGSQAIGDKIPTNSTLIFEVELISIK